MPAQRPPPKRRSACNRCRTYKLRCERDANRTDGFCERCRRTGATCSTTILSDHAVASGSASASSAASVSPRNSSPWHHQNRIQKPGLNYHADFPSSGGGTTRPLAPAPRHDESSRHFSKSPRRSSYPTSAHSIRHDSRGGTAAATAEGSSANLNFWHQSQSQASPKTSHPDNQQPPPVETHNLGWQAFTEPSIDEVISTFDGPPPIDVVFSSSDDGLPQGNHLGLDHSNNNNNNQNNNQNISSPVMPSLQSWPSCNDFPTSALSLKQSPCFSRKVSGSTSNESSWSPIGITTPHDRPDDVHMHTATIGIDDEAAEKAHRPNYVGEMLDLGRQLTEDIASPLQTADMHPPYVGNKTNPIPSAIQRTLDRSSYFCDLLRRMAAAATGDNDAPSLSPSGGLLLTTSMVTAYILLVRNWRRIFLHLHRILSVTSSSSDHLAIMPSLNLGGLPLQSNSPSTQINVLIELVFDLLGQIENSLLGTGGGQETRIIRGSVAISIRDTMLADEEMACLSSGGGEKSNSSSSYSNSSSNRRSKARESGGQLTPPEEEEEEEEEEGEVDEEEKVDVEEMGLDSLPLGDLAAEVRMQARVWTGREPDGVS